MDIFNVIYEILNKILHLIQFQNNYTYINFNFHHNYRIICIHFSLKQFSQLIFFRLEACYSKKWQERERSILNSWNYYFQVGSTGQEFDLNLVLQIDRRVNSCSFLCSFTVLKKMLQIYHSNSFVIVSKLSRKTRKYWHYF